MIRKKRGLGAGKINGVGGRLERGEMPLAGILREAREELGIALIDPIKRGELHFQFLDGYRQRWLCHVHSLCRAPEIERFGKDHKLMDALEIHESGRNIVANHSQTLRHSTDYPLRSAARLDRKAATARL